MYLSKVIMMCGVCGSGKTTYAKKKEQEGYIRLLTLSLPNVSVNLRQNSCAVQT